MKTRKSDRFAEKEDSSTSLEVLAVAQHGEDNLRQSDGT